MKTKAHIGVRPLEEIRDEHGNVYICDKGVEKGSNLKEQGCALDEEMAFTRND